MKKKLQGMAVSVPFSRASAELGVNCPGGAAVLLHLALEEDIFLCQITQAVLKGYSK